MPARRHHTSADLCSIYSVGPHLKLPGSFENLQRLNLAEAVAPIQLAIRLLIPRGSRLLELPKSVRWLERSMPGRSSIPGKKSPSDCGSAGRGGSGNRCREREDETQPDRDVRAIGEPRIALPAGKRRIGDADFWPRGRPVPYLNEPWYC